MWSFFNLFKQKAKAPPQVEKKAAPVYTGANNRKSITRNARGYAYEGYMQNPIVYGCVNYIAGAVSTIPLIVEKDGEHVPDHPLQRLIDDPSRAMGRQRFVYDLVSNREIAGSSPVEVLRRSTEQIDPTGNYLIRDDEGEPLKLLLWSPYEMQAIADSDEVNDLPFAYCWETGSKKYTWPVDQLDGSCNLLTWNYFSPLSRYTGQSPLSAAAYAADQHNLSSEHNASLLDNSASPSGALKVEMKEGTGELTPGQFSQLKQELRDNYQGSRNAGMPMLLEGNYSWIPMAMTPKDLDWLNGKDSAATDICIAYKIPPVLIGIRGAAQTFSNMENARTQVWEDNIIPKTTDLCDELTRWLAPMYEDGESLQIKPDLTDVPALMTRVKERYEIANAATMMSLNEKREFVGLPIRGDDLENEDNPYNDILVPSGVLPVGEEINLTTVPPSTEEEDTLKAHFDVLEAELKAARNVRSTE